MTMQLGFFSLRRCRSSPVTAVPVRSERIAGRAAPASRCDADLSPFLLPPTKEQPL
jgi:hypothetical protein